MVDIEALSKLSELKEKNIISEEEFQKEKEKLMNQPNSIDANRKSEVAYVLLAFFLGVFGVHNFYVGRWGRGLAQLLITLLTLFIGSLITYLWAIINIFTIRTDKEGRPFEPCPIIRYIFGIIGIAQYVWLAIVLIGIIGIGSAAGYQMANARSKANEILNSASMVAVMAITKDGGIGGSADLSDVGTLPECISDTTGISATPDGVVTVRVNSDCSEVAQMVKELAEDRLVNNRDCDSHTGCMINYGY